MNSKARVQAALKREPADRVPIWMWFHPETARQLGRMLEIPADRVSDVLGDDIRQAWIGNNYAMEGIVHERDGETHTDFWGIEWVKEGPFNQICRSPLQGVDEEQVRQYRYPQDRIPDLLENLKPVAAAAREFFVGADVSPCLYEMVCRVRGMEEATLDLAGSPELARSMLKQAGDFSVRLAEAACNRFPLDWLWTGDDVGSQQGMIMSPAAWRDLIKPLLAHVFQVGRSRGLWVAYHSCGAIRPIIPDLIEIGLSVLNPIQCNCPGMDPLELKREFGKRLAFMGGVDTQGVLPKGTRQEVHGATKRLVEGMTADGGGYILAASHTVPPETPMENILAMYEAAGVAREQIFDRAADVRAGRGGEKSRTG
jgi:uroporphyrinogen decarboxylase